MFLEQIKKPNDIKKIPDENLPILASEIREFLIEIISRKGGHLASNLGTVELTMALHKVLDFPEDKLVWDVGHQSYTHKILTGRKDKFETLREYGGLSGFPKRSESDCDVFDTGHSSTSISAGLGFVRARELNGQDHHVISVIGDGSMTGGEAFEALNNAGEMDENFVIILNDNNMSISENVGGLSAQLGRIRTSTGYTDLKEGVYQSLKKIPRYGDRIIARIQQTKSGIKQLIVPGMMFEEMGIMYLGPVDGHNIKVMTEVISEALSFSGPVLVHCMTEKGRGYAPAERLPSRFHGAPPFVLETGIPKGHSGPSYTDIFSTVMRKLGDREEKVVAVTAAMMEGTGLKRFHNMFPDRFFDVAIAEQHAVTFCAAMAESGFIPIFAVYSSFLQRAYDQMMSDVCLQDLHVIFAIDRAGLVGPDGETHHGIFDISFMYTMPNMVIMAPKNKWELSDMLKFAVKYDHPVAIRYPKGAAWDKLKSKRRAIKFGEWETLYEEGRVLVLAVGNMVRNVVEAREKLKEQGVEIAVTNARFVKPLDMDYLKEAVEKYDAIVTVEENVASGGFGEHVIMALHKLKYEGLTDIIAIPDRFVPQGRIDELMRSLGLDSESLAIRLLGINSKIKDE